MAFAFAFEALGGCVHVGFVRGKRRGRCFGVGAFAFAFGGRAADCCDAADWLSVSAVEPEPKPASICGCGSGERASGFGVRPLALALALPLGGCEARAIGGCSWSWRAVHVDDEEAEALLSCNGELELKPGTLDTCVICCCFC